MTEAERFFSRVGKSGGDFACWPWTGGRKGGRGGQDYGAFRLGRWGDGTRDLVLAHRWSYHHHFGNIDPGKVIHHACANKLCVNPIHLEIVGNAENYGCP